MLKLYLNLSKFKISILVIITAVLGYILGQEGALSILELCLLIFGVYTVSSGSFVLNQVHESVLDSKMDRTKTRPIPSGQISSAKAHILGYVLIIIGLITLSFIHVLSMLLAAFTCILYNFYYTLRWKRRFPFAAVIFGAIPGAMPVVIGYSVGASSILSTECFYLFMVMFLWQMPHFWALAFRYQKDYKQGGIPVLPVELGDEKTFFYMGLYMFAYLGVALLSPLFLNTSFLYLIIVFPMCIKLIVEFYFFYKQRRWLSFFLWFNLSLLVFLAVPLLDRWAVDKLLL